MACAVRGHTIASLFRNVGFQCGASSLGVPSPGMNSEELGRRVEALNAAAAENLDAARRAVAEEIRTKFPAGVKIPAGSLDVTLGAAGLKDKSHVGPITDLVNGD